MRGFRIIVLVFAALWVAAGCSFLHDDQVVARVEGRKLYRSQVVRYIPRGISKADSLSLARQYIHSWAAELIMTSMAEQKLSKKEKDVTREVEDYRSSLLKYRFEQRYIADRLDTVVTPQQVLDYYNKNTGLYALELPILKGRYLRMPVNSPLKDDIVEMMSSFDEDDLYILDSLSYTVADKYVDYGDKWIDILTLSREFGMEYGLLIAAKKGSVIDISDDLGVNHIAFLKQYIPSGKIPPLEYCRDKIRDMIIAQRKYEISSSLERELLDEAVETGNFTIYDAD